MGERQLMKNEAMFVVTVDFELNDDARERFLPLIVENAQRSLLDEAGCRQFDVCVDPERGDSIFLYEIYDDRSAFEMHLASPHFLAFDTATRDLVAHKHVRFLSKAA